MNAINTWTLCHFGTLENAVILDVFGALRLDDLILPRGTLGEDVALHVLGTLVELVILTCQGTLV